MKNMKENTKKTVRILPTLEGDKTPFKEVHFHRLRLPGDTNDRTVACLKENFGEYCPICEARNELYKAVNNKEKPLSESKKKAALVLFTVHSTSPKVVEGATYLKVTVIVLAVVASATVPFTNR